MEEVVAKRKGGLIVAYSIFLVIGLVFAIGGFILAIDELYGLAVAAIGLAFIGLGIWQIVAYCKVPKDIIVYRDGMLYLPKGATVSPLDITHCKVTITSRNGIANRWGKLTLKTSDGRQFVINYVDYIEDVQQRLNEIKSACYDEMMRQKYEAEAAAKIEAAKSAENTDATEKTEEGAAEVKTEKTDDPFDL